MSGELVLVTGGSGFIGAHCILRLLEDGYRVRTTVRSLTREPDARGALKVGGAEPGDALAFFEADLTADAGWLEAVAGCDYVLHVASPFPLGAPKHEDDVIIPAREGALRVLRASRDAGVKRVVLTSSFAAIGYGHGEMTRPFTEEDWTNPAAEGLGAYVKSKALAERAAWEFIESEGGALELAVVNPVGVLGPVLGPDFSTSIHLVSQLLDGSIPSVPRMVFNVVDVRDVADLHLRAMTNPAAAGERFLAVAGDPVALRYVATLLKSRMGDAARHVPSRGLPDWVLRFAGMFNSTAAQAASELGKAKPASNEKAKRVLGWQPRSNEEAILATAESLVRLGLVRK